ncbi:hypothetical protein [Halalkaliarchaeum desulfuricum]|uniref:hypothetical protein n=1 Tax=Halalkaliarchaeum desulfuricum TaxID=2055893 RepID=UPI000E6D3DEF|nr:hypothetical protein [Halalkaliarchaeum desulfuricum]
MAPLVGLFDQLVDDIGAVLFSIPLDELRRIEKQHSQPFLTGVVDDVRRPEHGVVSSVSFVSLAPVVYVAVREEIS